ncbi:alpha-L-rhamnosidase [Winogradskya humida]|uniref:alpha-L-rhamnosidase n=2 Tax=Winogradskya humida TaxID=113566 RepID=A0ABQ3ZXN0_9ACTN|nr:alpha-L-rhamnosidase [Actinoplanes humidus]
MIPRGEQMTRVSAPRFDHHDGPGPVLGLGAPAPRLSWVVTDAGEGWAQRAYEIEVTRDGAAPEVFQRESADQVLVPWPATPLQAREQVSVRARVRGDDEWSPWSEPGVAEAGLQGDWRARMITPEGKMSVLRGEMGLPAIAKARLHITAHGLYRAYLNGKRVGDHELAPGWTSYQHRLRHQTFDVTDLLVEGENTLDVQLGNGWYRGRLGFQGRRAIYGDELALLAQLEATTEDGTRHVLATNGDWRSGPGNVIEDDLYDGQRTDLRLPAIPAEFPGTVREIDADLTRLVAPDGPPVRIVETIPATGIEGSVVDFGQNIVGWVRLRVRGGEAGREVTIRHAEVLENGELGVRPLRTAKATDSWVLQGPEEQVLEPWFTFHGFRYAEIAGVPGLRAEDVEAVVISSDLRRTGWFESSHELLNRFHDNVIRGMRGNFVDVPTDCPQRDERLGWTGDIQVFAPTASFLFDSAGFLTSWLADLAAEQQKDGSVPFVIPDVLRDAGPAAAAWGDAATVVPWVVHERTGDRDLLARQFPSMRAWVDREAGLARADGLWAGGFQFGDWLDPAAPPEDPFRARTGPDVVATAYLARSADLVADAARTLGEDAAVERYAALAAKVRAAFATEFVTPGGRVLGDAPTGYALALEWALLPTAEQRENAGRRLADLVRAGGFRIATGFVGTPLMADALANAGEAGVAYRLLVQTGCPSWLYPVTMGATTVWERWDSMLPDGSINPGEMTSFNHYALGAVADWLHRRVAGLAPAAPGYRRIEVRPLPGTALTSAAASHLTPYGKASVSWQRAGGRFDLRVEVPVGATATVHLPGGDVHEVGHGTHTWQTADPVPEPAPLTPGSTVRDVLDDEPLWQRVVEAAVATGAADGEASTADRVAPYLDEPASRLIDALTASGFMPGADVIQRRLAALLPR